MELKNLEMKAEKLVKKGNYIGNCSSEAEVLEKREQELRKYGKNVYNRGN